MADAKQEYGDILYREHHVSQKHPRMPRAARAAQFAPFAALTGYDELIRESERETDELRTLEESEIRELNDRLVLLLQMEEAPEAVFTVFRPDGKKRGGEYVELRGRLRRFNAGANSVTLDSGETFPVEYIAGIDCEALSRILEP